MSLEDVLELERGGGEGNVAVDLRWVLDGVMCMRSLGIGEIRRKEYLVVHKCGDGKVWLFGSAKSLAARSAKVLDAAYATLLESILASPYVKGFSPSR